MVEQSKPNLLCPKDTDFVRDNLIINYCLGDDDQLLIESFVHNNHIDIQFDVQCFYFLITGTHKKFLPHHTPHSFDYSVGLVLHTYELILEALHKQGYEGNVFLLKPDNSKQFGVLFSPGSQVFCSPQEMAQHLYALWERTDNPYHGFNAKHYASTSFVGPYSGYEQLHDAFLRARTLNDLIFFGVKDQLITESFYTDTAMPCDATSVFGNCRRLINLICSGSCTQALRQAENMLNGQIALSYSMECFDTFRLAMGDFFGMLCTVYGIHIEQRKHFLFLADYSTYLTDTIRAIFVQLHDVHRYSPTLLMALSFIRQNFTRDLSLMSISEYVYANPSTLSSDFNAEVGMSLSEYITTLRVQRAQELLCSTDNSIAQIALQTGFSSAKYFRESFKKQTGIPPQRFRATHCIQKPVQA